MFWKPLPAAWMKRRNRNAPSLVVVAVAIPLGEDLGGFLRLGPAVLPRGGDEIVDEVIGDLAARRQLHLLQSARA